MRTFPARAALALAAFALAACSGSEPPAPAKATAALATAPVALREVELTVSTEAVVEAVRQSTVSAQVTGRVVDLRFDVGDRVEKGTVIARIDERAATQVAAAAEAQAREAEAAMLNARQNLDRTRQLFSQKFVSQASLDKAETDFRAAEARYKSVLAGAGAAATERSFTTIVAPYSGVVLTRHVQLGEMAAPGKPLLTGFDPSSLRAVATVPTGQAVAISSGSKARVEIPALERWIDARAVQVLPAADPRTQTTQVRIELPSDIKGLAPGVFARAHFVTGKASRLMVPRAAVFQRSEVTGVYVIDDKGAPRMRQIRVGTVADEQGVEVLSGLRAGEQVALEPAQAGMATAPAR